MNKYIISLTADEIGFLLCNLGSGTKEEMSILAKLEVHKNRAFNEIADRPENQPDFGDMDWAKPDCMP